MDVVVVGSGNVATHLTKAFSDSANVNLQAIISRNADHAKALAEKLDFTGYRGSDYGKIDELCPDIVLISVADNGIHELVEAIGTLKCNPLVLQTSGTVGKEALLPLGKRVGVFYPFQTFSKDVAVDVRSVPIITEVSIPEDQELVDALALSVSDSVHHADARSRNALHIAGVFSCNFTNFLLQLTQEHLENNGMSLGIVESLVRTTVDKAFKVGPYAAQTGPAVRGDFEVMRRQSETLEEPMKSLYSTFSRLILEAHDIDYEQDKL